MLKAAVIIKNVIMVRQTLIWVNQCILVLVVTVMLNLHLHNFRNFWDIWREREVSLICSTERRDQEDKADVVSDSITGESDEKRNRTSCARAKSWARTRNWNGESNRGWRNRYILQDRGVDRVRQQRGGEPEFPETIQSDPHGKMSIWIWRNYLRFPKTYQGCSRRSFCPEWYKIIPLVGIFPE